MGTICWARIDDRLIHGQVAVAWRRHLGYDEIWIVDDAVHADSYLQDVLRLAAPAGVQVRVYSVAEANAAYRRSVAAGRQPANRGYEDDEIGRIGGGRPEQPGRVLLLVRSPQTALALVEGGMSLPALNVGNIAAGPASERVFKAVSLSPQQIAALDALAQRGVPISFQQTPDDHQADWPSLRKRKVRL